MTYPKLIDIIQAKYYAELVTPETIARIEQDIITMCDGVGRCRVECTEHGNVKIDITGTPEEMTWIALKWA